MGKGRGKFREKKDLTKFYFGENRARYVCFRHLSKSVLLNRIFFPMRSTGNHGTPPGLTDLIQFLMVRSVRSTYLAAALIPTMYSGSIMGGRFGPGRPLGSDADRFGAVLPR